MEPCFGNRFFSFCVQPRKCSHNFQTDVTSVMSSSSCHEKLEDSLKASLDQLLFAAELEFPKVLVPKLTQNTSDVNIECAWLYSAVHNCSLCDQPLGALVFCYFIILILICACNWLYPVGTVQYMATSHQGQLQK